MSEAADNMAENTRQEKHHPHHSTRQSGCSPLRLLQTNVADIAKDLGMSPANVYRFFTSKAEIHQGAGAAHAGCGLRGGPGDCPLPVSAEERLRRYGHAMHNMTVETMPIRRRSMRWSLSPSSRMAGHRCTT